METNFFKQIDAINFQGELQLFITKGHEGNLIVSAILDNKDCGDKAKNLIPPFSISGTAEQLGSTFFQNLTQPIERVSELMVNMETFLKQVEKAEKASALEKERKKEKEEKAKKFKEAMSKVEALEKEGNPKEAWLRLPKIEEFPEHAQIIIKKRTELTNLFKPDLFGMVENASTEEEEKEEIAHPLPSDDDCPFNEEEED